ncbi:(2Fe-2S)-binding protein [Streptomyces sp. NPDC003703]
MHRDSGLAVLRPLGGFFVLRTGEPPHAPLPTLAEAYAASAADPLGARVRKVAGAIRAPEARIAASVAHLGLAARLWSVALGCAVRAGRLPDLAPSLLRWDPEGSAPDDLWLTEVRPLPAAAPEDLAAAPESCAATPESAAALADAVLLGHLEPLAAALRARHRLAPGLLRGNAASALAGAARQLGGWALGAGRPEEAARAHDLAVRLLAHPLLAGAGTYGATGFRRRSCCLYYRVPGGGVCGDCCFTRAPGPSPRAGSG